MDLEILVQDELASDHARLDECLPKTVMATWKAAITSNQSVVRLQYA